MNRPSPRPSHDAPGQSGSTRRAGRGLRVAVVGPSGSGKSTFTRLAVEYFGARDLRVATLKLAAPLYRLQALVYSEARVELKPGRQDQILLESLATNLRRVNPTALVDAFDEELKALEADCIINDDLRDPDIDAPHLIGAGFRIVRIETAPHLRLSRRQTRGDLSSSDQSTERIDEIPHEYRLQNDGTLQDYAGAVFSLMQELA